MALILSIANQKGGVAKTTTAVHLGAALAMQGLRTLLIDFDPQASLTRFFGLTQTLDRSAGDWVLGRIPFDEVKVSTDYPNLDIIPSHENLKLDEMDMQKDYLNAVEFLSQKINDIATRYDYILIDTLPTLSLLSLNGIYASQAVLIPTKLDYLSIDGLSQLVKRIDEIKKKKNVEILGILGTFFRRGIVEQEKCLAELKEIFPKLIFDTVIRINTRLDEAARSGQPIQHYDSRSPGAQDYNQLTREVIKRCQTIPKPDLVA